MRLEEKKILADTHGRQRVKRRHDRARTPFDRLCETGVLSPSQQQRLSALRKRTNPRQLRKENHALIEQILELPGADEDKTEDIINTLLTTKEEERLRWAAGYVDKSETAPDLPTYPQPLLLPQSRNGKTEKPDSLRLKETG